MAEPFLVRPLVAVVGGDTLLAREMRELLGETKPAPRVELISGVGEHSGVGKRRAGGHGAARRRELRRRRGGVSGRIARLQPQGAEDRVQEHVHDRSDVALEEQPNARLRAPFAEKEPMKNLGAVQVIAHPAAIAIAMLLTRLSECAPVRRSIIHVFEPASERGQKGLDELQQQNVAVLSFQKLKTDVFDTQLAFAMLARYGEEAEEPLEGIEQRVERHLASLLAAWDGIPMPSLRVIQAPVFHGHSFSAWVEFEENPGVEALRAGPRRRGHRRAAGRASHQHRRRRTKRIERGRDRRRSESSRAPAGSGWRPTISACRRKTRSR